MRLIRPLTSRARQCLTAFKIALPCSLALLIFSLGQPIAADAQTNTATPTRTLQWNFTPSKTPSAPTPTRTPTPSRTFTPTATRTPSRTPTLALNIETVVAQTLSALQTASRTPIPTRTRPPTTTPIPTFTRTPTVSRTPSPTLTRTPRFTATPDLGATAEVLISASETAQVIASYTKTPTRTPSATPTATPTPTQTNTPIATAISSAIREIVASTGAVQRLIVRAGELPHTRSASAVIGYSGTPFDNFIVQARFFNSYDALEGDFDYGFRFFTEDDEYELTVISDGTWALYLNFEGSANGRINNLNLRRGQDNLLYLIVANNTAFLFVNDLLTAEIPLRPQGGFFGIYALTATFGNTTFVGAVTRLEDFIVWEVPAPR
jgi:hypothetical protein